VQHRVRLSTYRGVSLNRRWVFRPSTDLTVKEFGMDIVGSAKRVVTGTAEATTAAAGAVGGAVVTGVIGGVEGTARGVRDGLSSGSHSTPLAALTLATVGAVGLVEWPVLVAIGGGALLLNKVSQRDGANGSATSGESTTGATASAIGGTTPTSSRRSPARSQAKKAATAPARKTAKKTSRSGASSRSARPGPKAARRSS
jgi:hypothetical protein